MMKNTFYFMLKALFVLEIVHFDTGFLIILKKNLIIKLRLISKFMTSPTKQHEYNTSIAQHLKSKGKHTMQFG